MAVLRLGAAYFAIVSAVAFALGVLRTLYLAPLLGETIAVLVELPVMLAAAWMICGRLLRGQHLSPSQALAMGTTAFALLMIAEAALSALLAGRSLAEHLALYKTLHYQIGLAGQVAFAAFPFVRR